jgi:hypothetical protein
VNLFELESAFFQELNGQTNSQLQDLIKPAGMTANERMDIYRSNTFGAQHSALQQIFPVCLQILGDDYFRQVARIYILQHPSNQPDLNIYGEAWPRFLADLLKQKTELADLPYLSDLALLEWQNHAAYYADLNSDFDFAALGEMENQERARVRLTLNNSLSLLVSTFPIYAIWSAHHNDAPQAEVAAISRPQYLCTYRDQFQCPVEEISQEQYETLTAIADRDSLEQLSERDRFPYLDINLPQFIEKGWVTGFFAPGQ